MTIPYHDEPLLRWATSIAMLYVLFAFGTLMLAKAREIWTRK